MSYAKTTKLIITNLKDKGFAKSKVKMYLMTWQQLTKERKSSAI